MRVSWTDGRTDGRTDGGGGGGGMCNRINRFKESLNKNREEKEQLLQIRMRNLKEKRSQKGEIKTEMRLTPS
jgi:hypothetical protein